MDTLSGVEYHTSLCAIRAYGGDVCTCIDFGSEVEHDIMCAYYSHDGGKCTCSVDNQPERHNQMADLVLTSKLGTFVFDKNTILSKAKLIRDSITGQFFTPRPGEPRITTELSAQDYARNHLGQNICDIPFDLQIKAKRKY